MIMAAFLLTALACLSASLQKQFLLVLKCLSRDGVAAGSNASWCYQQVMGDYGGLIPREMPG